MRAQRSCLRPLAALVLVWGLLAPPPLGAQGPGENELKARVVLSALLFIDWPDAAASSGQPLVLCLFSASPLATGLERLRGELVNRRRIEVRRPAATDAGVGCHVSYVGFAEAAAVAQRTGASLLLGDAPGLLERGVMLNLQIDQNRVVFDVNLAAARRAGIDINTRLLRLARFVRQEL